MTEIPEHLLKRSAERRAAAAAGGGDAGEATSSESAAPAASKEVAKAAPSMPAHPAPEGPAPAKPDTPMAAAYKARRKIPYWALPVVAILPVWGWVFMRTLDPPPAGPGPLELGVEAYSACAGCHGASGGGGSGPAFAGGAIYETWPSFEDHFEWVRLGSAGWLAEHGDTYGAPGKPVTGGMPSFSAEALSDADLVFILLHEREDLGGANPDPVDGARLEAVAELMYEHEEMTLEEALAEVDAMVASGELVLEEG